MGYYRGIVDDVLSRLVEAFLALPVILVALLTLVVLGTSPFVVIGGRGDPVHTDRRSHGAVRGTCRSDNWTT